MKKILLLSGIILLICYLLIDPKSAMYAAADGLSLWYENLLPVLLPFAIFSNILIGSGAVSYIARILNPLCKVLPYSPYGLFSAVCGLMFGFPMGAKMSASMYRKGNISKKETEVLCVIANNMSPAFVGGYMLCQELAMEELTVCTYLIIYLIPFLSGMIILKNGDTVLQTKKNGIRILRGF
jgi:nucleoside recognition membrane protein YjiH